MARKFGLEVEGIDLLDFNIKRAQKKAIKFNITNKVHFHEMDYSQLDFPDQTFDGVYTMETLVHAADYEQALKEFHRVLKPGGKIVLFEYSVPPHRELSERQQKILEFTAKASAAPSLPRFIHGSFIRSLEKPGFECLSTEDIKENIMPMVRKLARVGYFPYRFAKLIGIQKNLVNAMLAVEFYKYKDLGRYNIVVGRKVT